jgi:hypothetical protein
MIPIMSTRMITSEMHQTSEKWSCQILAILLRQGFGGQDAKIKSSKDLERTAHPERYHSSTLIPVS